MERFEEKAKATTSHGNSLADQRLFPAAETIEAARQGDRDALARLYRWLDVDLVRYLGFQDADAAEDIASETWIAVARNLRTFEGDARDFRRWVFTIAKRRLIDHRRRVRTRPTTVSIAAAHTSQSASDTAEEALLSTPGIVASMLSVLSPDQAEIVALRVLAGLDVDEVAAVVGRRPGTVRVQMHRALRRLARHASDHDFGTQA
jgi:RNA polymerase sigma-70 factor (ECF subfamily)